MTDPIALIHDADPAAGEAPDHAQVARMDATFAAMIAAETTWTAGAAALTGGDAAWARSDDGLTAGDAVSARADDGLTAGDAVRPGGHAVPAGDDAVPVAGDAARAPRDAAWAPPVHSHRRVRGSDPAVWRAAAHLRRRVARGLTLRRGGLVLGVAALAAAVVALSPSTGPAPAPANAATVLSQLGAKVAAAHAQDGRYAYQRTLSYESQTRTDGKGGEYVIVVPMQSETWVTDDGTVISQGVAHEDRATFPTPQDKAAYATAPKLPEPGMRPHALTGLKIDGLTARQILALPTDPAQLQSAISTEGMTETASVAQLLGWPLTPRPVRAALYAVLKQLPGATLVGTQKDPSGRSGVGVQFDDEAWTTLFLFDPASGDLLATRSYGKHEAKGRGTTDWTLILDQRRRDDAPAPTGPTQEWTVR